MTQNSQEIRRLGFALLGAVWLLTAWSGVVDHEHLLPTDGGLDCAVDHEGHSLEPLRVPTPEAHRGGQRHRHECLRCHLTSHRSLLGHAQVLASKLETSTSSRLQILEAPEQDRGWWGRTLRGPPSA